MESIVHGLAKAYFSDPEDIAALKWCLMTIDYRAEGDPKSLNVTAYGYLGKEVSGSLWEFIYVTPLGGIEVHTFKDADDVLKRVKRVIKLFDCEKMIEG